MPERGGKWPGALLARRTEEGMEPDELLCSRNAHDKNVLVGRAQWKLNQPPSLGEKTSRLGSMGIGAGQVPFLLAEPPR